MGQFTETYSAKTIEQMKKIYEASLEKAPQGAVFRARTEDAVITAYRSGKVLFQGPRPEIEKKKWGESKQISSTKMTKTMTNVQTSLLPTEEAIYDPPESLFFNNHIGSDESGTGDYFGPITTCAVYIKKEDIDTLNQMGIQDSKTISDETIIRLSRELVQLEIPYSLMILHNEKYNDLQARGWSQGKMKAMLHHSVIEQLLKKIDDEPYDGILIDQFCNPSVYKKHLHSEGKSLIEHTYFMTKAEDYSIAVAAGSVIARASFLNEMKKLSEMVGIELMKGASQKVDEIAARIIRTKGESTLPKIAKVHFANTKKARNYLL